MKLKPTKYYLKIIDEIEKIRTKNNINWMDVLRIAFRSSPKEARKIMIRINKADDEVSRLFNLCSKAWLLFELEGAEAAMVHLRAIASQQPWASSEPYVSAVIKGIQTFQTVEGMNRHKQTYFKRH